MRYATSLQIRACRARVADSVQTKKRAHQILFVRDSAQRQAGASNILPPHSARDGLLLNPETPAAPSPHRFRSIPFYVNPNGHHVRWFVQLHHKNLLCLFAIKEFVVRCVLSCATRPVQTASKPPRCGSRCPQISFQISHDFSQ